MASSKTPFPTGHHLKAQRLTLRSPEWNAARCARAAIWRDGRPTARLVVALAAAAWLYHEPGVGDTLGVSRRGQGIRAKGHLARRGPRLIPAPQGQAHAATIVAAARFSRGRKPFRSAGSANAPPTGCPGLRPSSRPLAGTSARQPRLQAAARHKKRGMAVETKRERRQLKPATAQQAKARLDAWRLQRPIGFRKRGHVAVPSAKTTCKTCCISTRLWDCDCPGRYPYCKACGRLRGARGQHSQACRI